MGAWSEDIFGNETAWNLRTEFNKLIGEGYSLDAAHETIMSKKQYSNPYGIMAIAVLELEKYSDLYQKDSFFQKAMSAVDDELAVSNDWKDPEGRRLLLLELKVKILKNEIKWAENDIEALAVGDSARNRAEQLLKSILESSSEEFEKRARQKLEIFGSYTEQELLDGIRYEKMDYLKAAKGVAEHISRDSKFMGAEIAEIDKLMDELENKQ